MWIASKAQCSGTQSELGGPGARQPNGQITSTHIPYMPGNSPPDATHGNFFAAPDAARRPGGAVTFALLIPSARLDATVASDALPAGPGSDVDLQSIARQA